jgi:hypothetical protein
MYEDILLGRRQKFTQGTWELHYGGKENFKGLLRYLVFERLTLTREQFLEEISFQFLKKWKLASPAQMLYQSKTLDIVNDIFPEWNIKGWELRMVPPFFWNEETIKEAIRHYYLCELKWDRNDLVTKFSSGMLKSTRYYEAMVRFRDMKLYENLGRSKSSAYALLLYCFPEYNLKIYEFSGTMENWDDIDIRNTLYELFYDKLGWGEDELKAKINIRVFIDNGFEQFFNYFFKGSTYRVMTYLFPKDDWEHLKRNKDKNFKNKPNYSMIVYRR